MNISKEDFERSYIYDGPMIQYSEATLDAMPLTKLSTKVEQTKVDVEGTMTEVLQWTIPANYAYEYFSANASMKLSFVTLNKIRIFKVLSFLMIMYM